MPLTIAYDLTPRRRTTRTAIVMDHFGIDFETGRHIVAENLELPIAPGDVVLFTGPSGAGKSSLLRAVASGSHRAARDGDFDGCAVIDIDALALPDAALIDALPLPLGEALRLLSSCGLGEARLLLRTPAELSDGQRYRFRLALAVAQATGGMASRRQPDRHAPTSAAQHAHPPDGVRACHPPLRERRHCVLADEFTATLDRTLAKVVAFNVRRLADRTGIGFLLATTHEDIAVDLAPDVHVHCRLDREMTVERHSVGRTSRSVRDQSDAPGWTDLEIRPTEHRRISFFDELTITAGTKRDWQRFARWHYRSQNLGFVRQVKLLSHGAEPIGICVFVSPPTSLKARNRYFGRSGTWSRTSLQALNRQLLMLSRIVLHPTYRGAGIAAWFVRQCCEDSGYPWIETLAQMGHIHPLFERAGFVRVGSSPPPRRRTRAQHSALYGNPVTTQTWRKSRHAAPVYYVFDNRTRGARCGIRGAG
jgi:GNAT superfamily N-acetyltransferase